MTNTNDMIHITQTKLQQLIRDNTARITKPKQAMVRKDRIQPHRPCMQDPFVAEIRQTGMTMDDLDPLSDEDLPEDRKTREDGGECRTPVHDPVG